MGISYEKLRKMTDEELAEAHDIVARTSEGGATFYLQELRHRETMRALHGIGSVVEHVASISLSASVVANYFLARWKVESDGPGVIEPPPKSYLDDTRIKVS